MHALAPAGPGSAIVIPIGIAVTTRAIAIGSAIGIACGLLGGDAIGIAIAIVPRSLVSQIVYAASDRMASRIHRCVEPADPQQSTHTSSPRLAA